METVECPQCHKIVQIETTYRTRNAAGEPIIVRNAHATIIQPTGLPNVIQCVCGKYL